MAGTGDSDEPQRLPPIPRPPSDYATPAEKRKDKDGITTGKQRAIRPVDLGEISLPLWAIVGVLLGILVALVVHACP